MHKVLGRQPVSRFHPAHLNVIKELARAAWDLLLLASMSAVPAISLHEVPLDFATTSEKTRQDDRPETPAPARRQIRLLIIIPFEPKAPRPASGSVVEAPAPSQRIIH